MGWKIWEISRCAGLLRSMISCASAESSYMEAVEALVKTPCRGFSRIVDARTDVDGAIDMVKWR